MTDSTNLTDLIGLTDMPQPRENDTIAALAFAAAAPVDIHHGLIWTTTDSSGDTHIHDIADRVRDLAQRPPATVRAEPTFATVDSFCSYLAKHALPETELYGSDIRGVVTAVIDAHRGAGKPAGHELHQALLRLTFDTDWTDWTTNAGKWLSQTEFADFIDDHLHNIVDPTPAVMLDLAQHFTAKKSVTFKSSQRLKDGSTGLSYVEDTTASAGAKGTIEIPDLFTIGVPVYSRRDPWKITARLRYKIHDGGGLSLCYRLDRPDDVRRRAFDDVVLDIEVESGRTVWLT